MTDNYFISPELADTMLAAMLSAHRRGPTISHNSLRQCTRAAHQQLINQRGGKHAKLYKTKHTSMVSQCCMAQTAPGA